jgi:hypothetical protein
MVQTGMHVWYSKSVHFHSLGHSESRSVGLIHVNPSHSCLYMIEEEVGLDLRHLRNSLEKMS